MNEKEKLMIKKKQYKLSDDEIAKKAKEIMLDTLIETMSKQIGTTLKNQIMSMRRDPVGTTKERIFEIISEQIEILCYNIELRKKEIEEMP